MITSVLLVFAGMVVAIIIGTLWYMPNTPTGKIHMRYIGFDKLSPEEQKQKIEAAKPGMPKIYAAQAFLSLLTSIAVVLIVTMSLQNGVSLLVALGFILFNWLCFVVPTVGMHLLWGNCDPKIAWQKFFSDSLNILVTMVVNALIVSVFV